MLFQLGGGTLDRGYPHPQVRIGGTPIPGHDWMGVTHCQQDGVPPLLTWDGVPPPLGLDGGTPVRKDGGTPHQEGSGYPHVGKDGGTPVKSGWDTPPGVDRHTN